MIKEATLHHPARDKKEKTSNNFLKSPLCAAVNSLALNEEEELQSVV